MTSICMANVGARNRIPLPNSAPASARPAATFTKEMGLCVLEQNGLQIEENAEKREI